MQEDGGAALSEWSALTYSLAKLVEKSGLTRSTVMSHLKHLETDTLVAKEEILQGRVGRPKMLYKPSAKLLHGLIKTESD